MKTIKNLRYTILFIYFFKAIVYVGRYAINYPTINVITVPKLYIVIRFKLIKYIRFIRMNYLCI